MKSAPIALTILTLAACTAESTQSNPASLLRSGRLQYTATTAQDGYVLLTGNLEIRLQDDSTATGTWSIHWAPGADTTTQVGPQVGSGTLAGHLFGDSLYLNLNPEMQDNNVHLIAFPDGEALMGRWEWSTIAGPWSGGWFSAHPRSGPTPGSD